MMVEEMLGAYALDALDEDERLLVDRHLSTCASCRQEIADHREVAALLAGTPIPPPDRVWSAILAEIAPVSEELGQVVPLRRTARLSPIMSTQWLARAAAAAAVVALSTTAIVQSDRIGDLSNQVTAQQQEIASLQTDPLQQAVSAALENPDARVANLTAEGTEATMQIVLLPDGTGYVYADTLSPLPDDATYQLWAVVNDRVVSAGVLGSNPNVVPFHLDPQGLQGLVITEEVAGGVPQSEADPVVAWFEA